MPFKTLKYWADNYHLDMERLEYLWNKAKQLALRRFKETDKQYWPYVVGILKRMVRYNTLKKVSKSAMQRLRGQS